MKTIFFLLTLLVAGIVYPAQIGPTVIKALLVGDTNPNMTEYKEEFGAASKNDLNKMRQFISEVAAQLNLQLYIKELRDDDFCNG